MDPFTTSDPFATSAGVYVLGALSPTDRAEFETHLRTCADCRRAVEELAGLPGLLSRTPPEVVDALTTDDPAAALRERTGVPDTVLPQLLRAVRRRRTTRRAVLAGGLVAAAGIVAAVLTENLGGEPEPTVAVGQSMEALVETPITATVQLTEVAWGTKVDLTCAYAHAEAEEPYEYALYVTDTDGEDEQIGTWTAYPGRDAQLSGATSWTRAQIGSVEVRTMTGTAILRLQES